VDDHPFVGWEGKGRREEKHLEEEEEEARHLAIDLRKMEKACGFVCLGGCY
jgi:hypothetical protein